MEVRKHLKKGKRSMVLKQVESQDIKNSNLLDGMSISK